MFHKLLTALIILCSVAMGQWKIYVDNGQLVDFQEMTAFYLQETYDGGYAGAFQLEDGSRYSLKGYPALLSGQYEIPLSPNDFWSILVTNGTVNGSRVKGLYVQETFDGGYAGVFELEENGGVMSFAGYPYELPPAQKPPVGGTVPEWWPTAEEPNRGWAAKSLPRGISPIAAGPHPHGYNSYVEALVANPQEIDQWISYFKYGRLPGYSIPPEIPWNAPTSTTSGQARRALSVAILHWLATNGHGNLRPGQPTAAECVDLASQYISIYDVSVENDANRGDDKNWPSGGSAYGYVSQQVLAILLGHMSPYLPAPILESAKRHAKWFVTENWEWRADYRWPMTYKAYPYVPAWHFYWDAHMQRQSHNAGVIWLLGEAYDSTDPEWVDLADKFGKFLYGSYLPFMKARSMGWPFDSIREDDGANWGLGGYAFSTYHNTMVLALSMLTDEDHFSSENTEKTFGHYDKGISTGLYEAMPNTWSIPFGYKNVYTYMVHYDAIKAKITGLMNEAERGLAYSSDPVVLGMLQEVAPNLVHDGMALERSLPWWYFRDTSVVADTDWAAKMPFVKRQMGEGFTICRTPFSEGEDSAVFAYRVGNPFWHHYRARLGMHLYHRGWLLPPTYIYHTYRAIPDDLPAKYTGVHIFDPADPSEQGGLNWQTHPRGLSFAKDGGPKRTIEPYTYDICQTYSSTFGAAKLNGPAPGVWQFDLFKQMAQRAEPESGNDREQSRQRFRDKGVVDGILWHAESHDYSPMFTKWPENRDYGPTTLAHWDPETGAYWTTNTGRYDVLSRTSRVKHQNGYVRSVVWLTSSTQDSETHPPCAIVFDQIETLDGDFAVENHWWSIDVPTYVGNNEWLIENNREVEDCPNYVAFGPQYVNETDPHKYQYAGKLHLQLWNGDASVLAPTDPSMVTTIGGPGMENAVVPDGVLSGNSPVTYNQLQSLHGGTITTCGGEIVPSWDPTRGPIETGRYYLAVHPPKGNKHHTFVSVLNTEINGTPVGMYPAVVTMDANTISVTVNLPSGPRTVVFNRSSFSVSVQ